MVDRRGRQQKRNTRSANPRQATFFFFGGGGGGSGVAGEVWRFCGGGRFFGEPLKVFCFGGDWWQPWSGGVAAAAAAAALLGCVLPAPDRGRAAWLAPSSSCCVVLATVRALPLAAVFGWAA